MLTQALLFVLGLAGLYFGAEWLVRGASRIARSMGITALVVGLTVVAFGTSAPELVVSVIASAAGQSDVAVGNVVGSNILNIALILGIAAVIHPMLLQARLLRREVPAMVLAGITLPLVAWNGIVSRLDGVLLLVGFVAYIAYAVYNARTDPEQTHAEYAAFEDAEGMGPEMGGRLVNVGLVVAGMAVLLGGARLLVGVSVQFARDFGISELVVGITIVAVGTSLPELATSVVAAMRREMDIAVGNIIGSNVFNSLAILGTAAVVRPLHAEPELLTFEVPVMVGFSVLVLPLAYLGRRLRLGRWEGVVFLVGYVIFMVVLVARAVGAG
jgi:cation:H+ antiporter